MCVSLGSVFLETEGVWTGALSKWWRSDINLYSPQCYDEKCILLFPDIRLSSEWPALYVGCRCLYEYPALLVFYLCIYYTLYTQNVYRFPFVRKWMSLFYTKYCYYWFQITEVTFAKHNDSYTLNLTANNYARASKASERSETSCTFFLRNGRVRLSRVITGNLHYQPINSIIQVIWCTYKLTPKSHFIGHYQLLIYYSPFKILICSIQ